MFGAGLRDPDSISPQQRVQMTWGLYEFFGAFEYMLHAHKNGALPDEVWKRWEATIRYWLLNFDGVRQWWGSRPAPFTDELTDFVESTMLNGEYDFAAVEKWALFIRGDEALPEESDSD